MSFVAKSVLEIPNGPEVNFVIGKGGQSINALQAETGTHIDVQRASDVARGALTRQVTITGGDARQQARCVELVRSKVLEYQALETAAPGVPPPPQLLIEEVPNGPAVNYLIGPKGCTINALQQETGTHISIAYDFLRSIGLRLPQTLAKPLSQSTRQPSMSTRMTGGASCIAAARYCETMIAFVNVSTACLRAAAPI